jgi:hypothetical protein
LDDAGHQTIVLYHHKRIVEVLWQEDLGFAIVAGKWDSKIVARLSFFQRN